MRHWLLPEFVEDILPDEALAIERLRARMLELFRVHGYQLVVPPLIEYVDSLLTGAGRELDLATFRLVDQLSGRHMGLRADHTPQAARIDAHLLNRQGATRLCYAGPVLRTRPAGLTAGREALQIGAELYGHRGLESDVEVQRLMLQALAVAGIAGVQLDLGHVGIFHALAEAAQIDAEREREVFEALQTKDSAALDDLLRGVDNPWRNALLELPALYGGIEVLSDAGRLPRLPGIVSALDELKRVASAHAASGAQLSFDLAELTGYHYHSGVVFAAYASGNAAAIARGGRYDGVGRAFGRDRPATGFSIVDLRDLVELTSVTPERRGILAPLDDDRALAERIAALRSAGEVVAIELPGCEALRDEINCDRRLVAKNGRWEVENWS